MKLFRVVSSVTASALFAVAGISSALPAAASQLTREQMMSDLDQLVAMIKAGYGPLQYKKEVLGIDVDSLRQGYLTQLDAVKNNGEFYYLMRRFVAEFKDSHFSARVPSFHGATLGFGTDWVDGKVVIEYIDRSVLPVQIFDFHRGDEVLAVDGRDVRDLAAELSRYASAGYEKTALRVGAMGVAFRPGSQLPVPRGPAMVRIRKSGTGEVADVSLGWLETGEPLDERPALETLANRENFGKPPRNFRDISIFDFWSDYENPAAERKFRCSGDTRIDPPAGAVIITETPFVSYYHSTPKGNVGYLRIPHYSPQNEVTGAEEYDLRFSQYEYAVSVLEKNTVGLIIDQDHNCGGSVDYLERMLGLFMHKDYQPMQFRLLANKQEYLDFSGWLKSMDPSTIAYHDLKKTSDLIRQSWMSGEFMTPMTSLFGVETKSPHFIRYTKPIVMLIDELSGSGGDAFPALMKGYGRAKLLGTRTMGAGGHVTEQPPLFYSQVAVRMTKSLFYRPDGIAVENNGAEPDYPYSITLEDYTDGYRGYQAFYLNRLMDLISQ